MKDMNKDYQEFLKGLRKVIENPNPPYWKGTKLGLLNARINRKLSELEKKK